MERRIILMRHAKSSWGSGVATDHERPLNERGRQSAPLVAQRLVHLGWIPEQLQSSDATRTRETWALMRTVFGDADIEEQFVSELYGAGLREIRALAESWHAEIGTMLLLGHNPGFEDTLQQLSGEPERMTTANAALLTGAGDSWRNALHSDWKLVEVIRPRDLD